MLDEASQGHEVAMLVVGDPFGYYFVETELRFLITSNS
jgi:precorrin-2 methylase